MDVSVVICTRDRAASLARTLQSLGRMSIPKDLRWELIVIDNASTDETNAVLTRFQRSLPLRWEFEAAPGVSNAKNHAVTIVQGNYILWTDDDVIVDPLWLAAYIDAFCRWPDGAFFGGKIIPLFDEPMPHWLRDSWPMIGNVFAYRDFGDQPIQFRLEGNRLPYSANFAIRAAEQRAYLYDPTLGPGTWVPGEETDVIERMLKDGKSGYWVPEAKVQHCTSRSRQTTRYIGEYYRKKGRATAYVSNSREYTGPQMFGVPRWLVRRMALNFCKFHLTRWTSPPATWIDHFVNYAMDRGYVEFCRRQH